MPIEFLVIGDERMRLQLAAMPHVLRDEIDAASRSAALWLEAGAKMFIAPHSKTGNLERSVSSDVRHVPATEKWEVLLKIGLTAPYGIYVNFGTGIYHTPDPHTPWVIEPHPPRRALRFMVDGQPVFRRRVTRMGSRPVQFIERSWDANEARIRERYRAIPGNVIRRLEATP